MHRDPGLHLPLLPVLGSAPLCTVALGSGASGLAADGCPVGRTCSGVPAPWGLLHMVARLSGGWDGGLACTKNQIKSHGGTPGSQHWGRNQQAGQMLILHKWT